MSKKELWSYWDSFQVKEWYPYIKCCTFRTEFVDIAEDVALLMMQYMEGLLQVDSTAPLPAFPESFKPLEERLSLALSQVGQGQGGFVKLGDRSPKDAATERGRIEPHLEKLGRNMNIHLLEQHEWKCNNGVMRVSLIAKQRYTQHWKKT